MEISCFMSFFQQYDLYAVFLVLVLCGLGLPLPEDITLITAGLISYTNHNTSVQLMIFICLLGVLVGDFIAFMIGYICGEKIIKNKFVKKIITDKNQLRIDNFYFKYGKLFIFIGRFLPGLRMPIFLFAGIFRKLKPSTFLFIDLLAAIISVPIWVYVGYYFGGDFKKLQAFASDNTGTIGFCLIALLFIYLIIKTKTKTKSNDL